MLTGDAGDRCPFHDSWCSAQFSLGFGRVIRNLFYFGWPKIARPLKQLIVRFQRPEKWSPPR